MAVDTQQLDFDRIRILYGAMSRIAVGGFLLIVFLTLLLLEHLELKLLLTWSITTLLLYGPRIYITWLFSSRVNSKKITPDNVAIWEYIWLLTTIPVLAAFTSLLFYPMDIERFEVVAIFLVILASGSIMSCASSLKTIIASNWVIYIPLSVRCFMEGDTFFTTLGFVFIACVIVFGSYALSLNRSLLENIQLKIENENNSLKDQLTGLYNRRGLYFFLNKIIPRSIRNDESFGIIMMDIDHFKRYNDQYGHSAGDDALINVATCIQKEEREEDLLVRYGGEEFLAILPHTDIEQLKDATDRIFRSVRNNSNLTISAGLAIYQPGQNFDELLNQADIALYAAKNAGRDQYMIASENNLVPLTTHKTEKA